MTFDSVWSYFGLIILVSIVIGIVTVAYTIVRQKGNPTKTISWILVVIFLPVIGFLLYLSFGLNYRRRKIYKLKQTKDLERYYKIIEDEYYQFDQLDWIKKPEVQDKMGLAKLLLKSSKSLFSDNNEVQVLQDGHQSFDKTFYEH